MKKFGLVLLILAMIAAVAVSCTACEKDQSTVSGDASARSGGDHQHSWSEWTDMIPEFIIDQGPEAGEAVRQHLDHEHLRYCSCGAIEYQAHVPGEAQIAAYDPNYAVTPCAVCGHLTDIVQLEFASEMSYDDEMHWYACLTSGYEDFKRMCAPHDFVSEQVVVQPTLDTPGQIEHRCSSGHTVTTVVPCISAETCEPYLTFTLNADGNSYALSMISKDFPYTALVVPAVHEGKPVTAIVPKAEAAKGIYETSNTSGIQTFVLPESVTVIGDSAFKGSRLRNINLGSVREIGESAFSGCYLTFADLSSVTSMGREAFYNAGLTSLILGDGFDIPQRAFASCKHLHTLTIGNARIGNGAFYTCPGLVQVRLNEGVQEIGDSAFYDCKALAEVINYSDLHLTVGGSDNGQVAKNALWIASDIAVDPSRILYNETYHLWYYCHYLGDPAHLYDTRVLGYDGEDSHLIVPAALDDHAVDSIIDGAFFEWTAPQTAKICYDRLGYTKLLDYLTSLEFLGSEIDPSALSKMEELATVILPEGAAFKVVDNVLYSADGKTLIKALTSYTGSELTLTDGMTVYPSALCGLESLVSLTVDGDVTVPVANGSAVVKCENLANVTYTDKVTVMPLLFGEECYGIRNVVLGANVREIVQYPVGNPNQTVDVITIPASVEQIGENAFGLYISVNTLYYNAVNCTGGGYGALGAKNVVIGEDVESVDWLCNILLWSSRVQTNEYDGMHYLAKGSNPYWALAAAQKNGYNRYETNLTSFTIADGCEWIDMGLLGRYFDWVVVPASITRLAFKWNSYSLPAVIYYKGAVDSITVTRGSETDLSAFIAVSYYSESAPTDTTHAYWHYDAQGQPVSW